MWWLEDNTGFLGTRAPFVSDVTLGLMVLSMALFTWGWVLVRRGELAQHGLVQSLSVLINTVTICFSMLLPFVHRFTEPRYPLPVWFYAVLIAHGVVGVVGMLFGVWIMLSANGLLPMPEYERYRPLMRSAYWLYLLATVLGVAVYAASYVILPQSPH